MRQGLKGFTAVNLQKGIPMNEFLKIRNSLIGLYKRNETAAEAALKAAGGFIVFLMATSFMPCGILSLKRLLVVLFGALISIAASPLVFMMLAGLVLCASAAMASVEAGAAVFVFCILLFLFYVRIFPKESMLFAAMLVLYKIGVPYVVVVAAGLYVGPAAIVPVCAAVFAHSHSYMIGEIIKAYPFAQFSTGGALDSFMETAQIIYENISLSEGWLVLCLGASVAILASWAVSSSFADWEKEKAIALSGIILIISGIISAFMPGKASFGFIGTVGMIISVLLSCALAYVITLFECVKDYRHTEKVAFQDSHYVYYVKAVPKVGEFEMTEKKHHPHHHPRVKKAVKKRPAQHETVENEE